MQSATDETLQQEVTINATPEKVWAALIQDMGSWFISPEDNKPMGLRLEASPGGRFYRDLGEGAGHLWGHVQVIKPPMLLELTGPMFMSAPVLSHVAFRLSENGGKTTLTLTHAVNGPVSEEFREKASAGWRHILEGGLKNHVEQH